MENATKALLIAGGVLIAIIIISVLVITLQKTGNVSKSYDKTVQTEEVTTFNSNFTKYLGQKITIHEVVTICNFAQNNNTHKLSNILGIKTEADIANDIERITTTNDEDGKVVRNQPTYTLKINGYDNNGYVDSITITNN